MSFSACRFSTENHKSLSYMHVMSVHNVGKALALEIPASRKKYQQTGNRVTGIAASQAGIGRALDALLWIRSRPEAGDKPTNTPSPKLTIARAVQAVIAERQRHVGPMSPVL